MSAIHPKRTLSGSPAGMSAYDPLDIRTLPQVSRMNGSTRTLMRASLWLLFAGAAAISLFWWVLVLASGSQIWSESNGAGLLLQTALFLIYPVALFAALKKLTRTLTSTVAVFATAWCIAVAALVFFEML